MLRWFRCDQDDKLISPRGAFPLKKKKIEKSLLYRLRPQWIGLQCPACHGEASGFPRRNYKCLLLKWCLDYSDWLTPVLLKYSHTIYTVQCWKKMVSVTWYSNKALLKEKCIIIKMELWVHFMDFFLDQQLSKVPNMDIICPQLTLREPRMSFLKYKIIHVHWLLGFSRTCRGKNACLHHCLCDIHITHIDTATTTQ